DKCPLKPENINGYQDDDGCPDSVVVVQDKKILILQRVLFVYGTTKIKEDSFGLLQEVAQVLKDRPEILKVRIEGHTDNRGPRQVNQDLSTGRARSVQTYLIKAGIDGRRLRARGYGESRLLVRDAKSEEDHQKNRRVDFVITRTK
ncbi:MAG: outer membrane protein OmpA-like peptidoglycan-associated protein, partial [Myxococcota bacterium]